MGSVKILISEKDSVELEYNEEMDLAQALNHIGFSVTPFNENKILTDHNYQVLVNDKGNVLAED